MSCSDRRYILTALAALPVGLSACGFTPLYSENQPASRLRNHIAIAPLEGRFGFNMRDQLETRLGQATSAEYELRITTELHEEGRAIRSDNTISRINLRGDATFSVTPLNTTTPIFTDRVSSFTAYSTIASPFATQVAAEDASKRLATALADQIALRLAITASDWLP